MIGRYFLLAAQLDSMMAEHIRNIHAKTVIPAVIEPLFKLSGGVMVENIYV